MTYFKCVVDGETMTDLSNREKEILQNAILNFAAMTNAIITGKGVMLNPPEANTLGITFAYPEPIESEKEMKVKESLVQRLNNFFNMSNLTLTAEIQ